MTRLGFLRAFLFAPSARTHARDVEKIRAFLPALSATEVIEGAYRGSTSRQASFYFAQGIAVGALGNIFASAIGHFIDRQGAATGADALWAVLAALSLGIMAAMTWGALRRYRQDGELEELFLVELRRRGGASTAEGGDPDDLLAMEPGRHRVRRS